MESQSKEKLAVNPRKTGNFLSILTFAWVLPMLFKGRKKVLDMEDLYQPLDDHYSNRLGDRLEAAWHKEIEKKKRKKQAPSLMSAGLSVFGGTILFFGTLLLIFELAFRVTLPFFLGGVIQYFDNPAENSLNDAYIYATGIIVCSFCSVIANHALMISNLACGMKLRIAACSLIYRKSLRLSKCALINTTSGQIVNLLSNDVGRFDMIVMFFHYLWVGPLQMVVVTLLMYFEIGISAIAGVIFLLAFIPFQFYLGKKTSDLRLKTALRTDERIRLMNEIIQGIQVIKMYAWEKPFSKFIEMARKKEIRVIRYASWIRGILVSFIIFSSRASIFTSLAMFALLGNVMTSHQAFVITAYYNVVRQTMTVFFPSAVGMLAETFVSVKRLEKFMLYDELERETEEDVKKDISIDLTNVVAKWQGDATDPTLKNITMNIQNTKTVAVIGKVGSGKSTLLQTILGELKADSGSVKVNGKVSYASQDPWLFSSSIRQNILFGEKMDRKRYKDVLRVCALNRDIDLWPDGDQTIVGERGMSLSGGQKARINLARAVYREADIYLLDDPLSAVDTHVGRHLFDQCISEYLKQKLVIIVTHQLQFLKSVDQVVILNEGTIDGIGTYSSLQDSGLDFAKLLPTASDESVTQNMNKMKGTFRQNSVSSVTSQMSEEPEQHETRNSQPEESRAEGSVGLSCYKQYFRASGRVFTLIIVTIFFLVSQIFASASDYFLSYWVRKEGQRLPTNETNAIQNAEFVYDRNIDIYIFSALTVGTIFFTVSRSFLFFNLAMIASKRLHNAMFYGVTKASMFFFNTNPSGRILNRFSKDIGQVDETLPMVMIDVFQIFLSLVGIVAVVASVNPLFLIPTIVIAIIFYFLRSFYLKTSRDLKRLEATTRSPIFSHLAATLNGLGTIRAFQAEQTLKSEFDNYQDLNSSAYFMFIAAARAFGFWLDFILVIYTSIVVLSFFVMENTGGYVGLAITQAMGLTGMVQWGMRQSAELENTMTAVERVIEYRTVDPEPEIEDSAELKALKSWPDKGNIKFSKVSLSYFPDSKDKVLHDLEFEIKSAEKIGIVGRTGAGKSSILSALFRLSYLDGQIIIDDLDTQTINLETLRSKISVIPQEPVLFSASMRYNLDPFDEYPDEKLWDALEEVKLKKAISEMPAGLNTKVAEGGSNFSIGQKQLVCLARAILRDNKILLMDEATANVDPETDGLIQSTIREKFVNCTVLTIAHRLSTVIDYDKILVMDAGKCVEFASPFELLHGSEKGIFYGMVMEQGRSQFQTLKKLSEITINKRGTSIRSTRL